MLELRTNCDLKLTPRVVRATAKPDRVICYLTSRARPDSILSSKEFGPATVNMAEEVALDVLCHTCQNVFAADPSLSSRMLDKGSSQFIAHHRIGALSASAGNACHLCTLILAEVTWHCDAFTENWVTHQQRDDQIWLRFNIDKFKSIDLELYLGAPSGNDEEKTIGAGTLHLRKSDSMYSHCSPCYTVQADHFSLPQRPS